MVGDALECSLREMQHTFYTHNHVGKVCTCTTAKHHLKPNLAFGVYDFRIQCENHNKCVFECRVPPQFNYDLLACNFLQTKVKVLERIIWRWWGTDIICINCVAGGQTIGSRNSSRCFVLSIKSCMAQMVVLMTDELGPMSIQTHNSSASTINIPY